MSNSFVKRHLGPREYHIQEMLSQLGFSSLDELSSTVVPKNILTDSHPTLPPKKSEPETIKRLQELAGKNSVFRSYIGMGYYGTVVPGVIKRNILENPGWYTAYTPYQAEISQGRLEALLNFQTMIADLTGLPLANSSLLDEGTGAAEAMLMFYNSTRNPNKKTFLVSDKCHPQTIDVLKTRSEPLGIHLKITNHSLFKFDESVFGALVQYPDTEGAIRDFSTLCDSAHENKSYVCMATDLMALTLLKSPGDMGADAAVGNSQRFGVPMGYGGPHAGFFAASEEFKRKIPGRIIGVSQDAQGHPALRMALQTREQHIRREKATSNICTAQVLLAIMSGMYAVYHGPNGLKEIAQRINRLTTKLALSLEAEGLKIVHDEFFDTIKFKADSGWQERAKSLELNLRDFGDETVGISIDETTTEAHLDVLLSLFKTQKIQNVGESIPSELIRTSPFLDHPVFHTHHSETEMLRYLRQLSDKDIALDRAMIPLGSCTMKLNATAEMLPITWPEFSNMHPFAPNSQTVGYQIMIEQLEKMLCAATGYDAMSLQPNAGSQGEYAGLLAIRGYHESRGDSHRTVCLIPSSAHGTNPASAQMCGMSVVVVKCDDQGNVDIEDLNDKATLHANKLSAIMVTYPSTHGVFEEKITDICDIVHQHGGQVYIDGANLNAMVGVCQPGKFGGDVSHLNLHKTFCIPHGGGGPGVGPIGVGKHLAPFLPRESSDGDREGAQISAAPFGSASILPITWMYIRMMGRVGLKQATEVAILNANYIAKRLQGHYEVLYTGTSGRVAHECILDVRPIKDDIGISVDDIAKRLIDFGFHAPTMSFPVAGTLMIEPTESESQAELDRFCDAMIAIRAEIDQVASGEFSLDDNPLAGAPHTAAVVSHDDWPRSYTRSQAAYPLDSLRANKYWPPVGRLDHIYGDRNLVCSCPSIAEYE